MNPDDSSKLADRIARAERALAALAPELRGEVWWSEEARHTCEIAPELPAARQALGTQGLLAVRVWDREGRMGSAASRWHGEALESLLARARPGPDAPLRPFPGAASSESFSGDLSRPSGAAASSAAGDTSTGFARASSPRSATMRAERLVEQAWALHASTARLGTPIQALWAQATREQIVLARSGQRTQTAVREHSQAFVRVETPRGAILDSVAASGDGTWELSPVLARLEDGLAAVADDTEPGVAVNASLPHVLRPAVAAPLLSALAFILRADVGLAQPALARAVGKRVFPACLTVTDEGGPGGDAPAFDDEGLPLRPLTLVDAGVLATFLHTATTAAPGESNGRAQRVGDSGLPVPGAFSLGIAPGTGELPADCNEWCARLEGFTVMPKVGHVRVIAAGWERRGGQRVRRLAPVELELPVLATLRRIVSVGRDVATFPALEHVRCPTLVLAPG